MFNFPQRLKNIFGVFVFVFLSFIFITTHALAVETATYNFVGVTTSNDGVSPYPIAIEHDSDVFPWTTSADQNDSANPSDAEYVNISVDNTSEWATNDPSWSDEMAITFRFFIQQSIEDISSIRIKWNGHTNGSSASNHSMWLRKDGFDEFGGTNTWVQLGSSLLITQDVDTDFIRDLTSDFSTYINGTTGQFEFVVTTDNDSEDMRTNYVEVVVSYDVPPPQVVIPVSEGGVAPTRVEFSGQAYPNGSVEVLRKDNLNPDYMNIPSETYSMSDAGEFRIAYTALLSGEYFFALRGVDKDGRKTGALTFGVDFTSDKKLIASDIFFSPTVGFDQVSVEQGQDIKISGYSAADSSIEIVIDGIINRKTRSDNRGYWEFTINTERLSSGDHYLKVRQADKSGKISGFSFPKMFKISSTSFSRSDLNGDERVDISDWSIFLFRWGSDSSDKVLRSEIDLDNNGKIDISDFSIFLKAMEI